MTPIEINKRIASMRDHDGIDDDHAYSNDKNMVLNWAENISDAWELFEEMPRGTSLFKSMIDPGIVWCVEMMSDEFHELILGESPEASTAICLAWLKWKMGSK